MLAWWVSDGCHNPLAHPQCIFTATVPLSAYIASILPLSLPLHIYIPLTHSPTPTPTHPTVSRLSHALREPLTHPRLLRDPAIEDAAAAAVQRLSQWASAADTNDGNSNSGVGGGGGNGDDDVTCTKYAALPPLPLGGLAWLLGCADGGAAAACGRVLAEAVRGAAEGEGAGVANAAAAWVRFLQERGMGVGMGVLVVSVWVLITPV